jgi:hypothetical protein
MTWIAYIVTGIVSHVLCLITGNLSHRDDIPDILDIPSTSTVSLCLYHSLTVQLPMHVLHSICYGYTYSGDDQSPNVNVNVAYRSTVTRLWCSPD